MYGHMAGFYVGIPTGISIGYHGFRFRGYPRRISHTLDWPATRNRVYLFACRRTRRFAHPLRNPQATGFFLNYCRSIVEVRFRL